MHGTTHEKPHDRFARAERLIPVDLRPPAPRERLVIRRVPTDCYVAVETNRYPVPFTWAGRDIEVQVGDFPGTQKSAIGDITKRLALTGPCKVPWRDGMRRMVEARAAQR